MTIKLHIYRPRRFRRTWFGVNRPSGCWVLASTIFQLPLSCPWTCPLCPHGQMTKTLLMYRPRWFQRTWFGVNHPSGCWVPASTRFQGPLACPWAWWSCPHGQMWVGFVFFWGDGHLKPCGVGVSFNLFMATTGDVWMISFFRIWDYVLHVERVSCVITNCGQYQ